ncbi:hypothetical protein BFD29_14610 [Escherichia coli]|nr:hypothetical protein [Escherichia coli]EJD1899364.1 hypothetical protein [Escherichia coli]EKV5765702.1 hypothetical protein [Escherichia coli]EKW5587434.1 hypothetical protein [Escherichia coli]ELR9537948.1 hypothetical protein [Escherichia coli]
MVKSGVCEMFLKKCGNIFCSTAFTAVIALSVPSISFAEDFSKIDCNATKTRQMLIDDYNELLKDEPEKVTVIDAYDQINEISEKNKLQCLGTYEFSDGSTLRVRYNLYLNSLGTPIYKFVPVEDLTQYDVSASIHNAPATITSAPENNGETYACKVAVTYNGKRSNYMGDSGTWDRVITDYGSYFSWDLPRGNRGNSTGQDAFSGIDVSKPVLENQLVRKEVEKDGSVVDEFRTEVSYGERQSAHKFVYARRIKPTGTREYYVTDLTDKRAFMFLNCQQDS